MRRKKKQQMTEQEVINKIIEMTQIPKYRIDMGIIKPHEWEMIIEAAKKIEKDATA